ncbi:MULTISPECIES: WGxxGxxG family protein [unclassified Paenibacillus]|uniref:WGxxGxxG family protein n=1 Tax=unclassified Paenibacillus TaxID=185978 RepID=UPI000955627C|nr:MULTISPECIES: WGxxGxxG family protein [unclassified Paenibacillus]SIR06217.1 MYXO-CTERM domain-containing protein [Paenibacillus sp. RU4X]
MKKLALTLVAAAGIASSLASPAFANNNDMMRNMERGINADFNGTSLMDGKGAGRMGMNDMGMKRAGTNGVGLNVTPSYPSTYGTGLNRTGTGTGYGMNGVSSYGTGLDGTRMNDYRTNSYNTNGLAAKNYTAKAANGKSGSNWGWLGLLGLFGLAGMRNRNPERH